MKKWRWREDVILQQRLLFPAFFCGSLADWLDFIVISSLITYSWQMAASEIATAFIIYAIPKILFSGLAGSFTARKPLVQVFAISLGARALAMVAMAFLATDMLSLCLLIFVKSTFSVLYLPAEQLTIKGVAGRDDDKVAQLSGWLQIIHQGAKLVGPAAGGALLVVMGPSEAFLVSAALFAIALVMILVEAPRLAAIGGEQTEEAGDSKIWQDLVEGARYAKGSYPLNLALLLVSTALLVIFLYDNFIPLLTKNIGFDTSDFGMTISLVGLGGVIGGYFAIGLTRRFNPIYIIPTAICLSGPPMIYFGLCETGMVDVFLPLFLAAWFFVGIITSVALVPFNTYVVKTCPKNKLGVITGLNESVQTIGVLVGPIMGAAVVEQFGVGAVFILGGLLSLFIATIGFTTLAIRPPAAPGGKAETSTSLWQRYSAFNT